MVSVALFRALGNLRNDYSSRKRKKEALNACTSEILFNTFVCRRLENGVVFDVMSSSSCLWMKTKDLTVAPFVRSPAIVLCL